MRRREPAGQHKSDPISVRQFKDAIVILRIAENLGQLIPILSREHQKHGEFRVGAARRRSRCNRTPVQTYSIATVMRRGYERAGVLALWAVFIFVFGDFRNLRDTALATVPLLLDGAWLLEAMGCWDGSSTSRTCSRSPSS